MRIPRRRLFGLGGLAVGAALGAAQPATASAAAAAGSTPRRRSVLLRYSPSGAVQWQRPLPIAKDGFAGGPTVGGDTVFVAQHHELWAFDLATGARRWRVPVGGLDGQLLATDGLILLQLSDDDSNARVLAFDQPTGTHRWTYDPGVADIQLHGVRPGLVIAQQRFTTVALDTATGRPRWRAPVPDHDDGGQSYAQIAATPSLVLQGGEQTAVALDASTGRRLWAMTPGIGPAFPFLTGSVAVLAPMDAGGSAPGGVLAYDARSGRHRWTLASKDESGSVVAAGHGVVVAATGGTVQGGRTAGVETESGRVLWSAPIPAADPSDAPTAISAHGVAYVEDLWHDGKHTHRVIDLVNRRLRDGRVLYRRPISEPIAQGEPPQLAGRYLPLMVLPTNPGPVDIRLFDLARHRVAFSVPAPLFPASTPVPLPDGSAVCLTADLVEATPV